MSLPSVEFALNSFVTLFLIVDPIGNIPFFVSFLGEYDVKAQKEIIRKAVAIACVTLILFTIVGKYFLAMLGVEFYSFRIAGGVLLFIIALEMLFGRKTRTEYSEELLEEKAISEVAITPLAIPLLTGPGAITAALAFYTLSENLLAKLLLIFNIFVVFVLAYVILASSRRIFNAIGKSGTVLILRIMGLVLSSIAVQFIIQGIREAGVIA